MNDKERLDKAIAKIVLESDTVRFLLYGCWDISSRRFHDLFATAAYRAKLANPHKEIRLSIVAPDEERGQVQNALQKWQYPMPSFMFDEILSPPTPQGIKDAFAIEKRTQRWMIGQADFVFTYLYDCLHETVSLALDYALKIGKAVVDLTNPSTYALIREKYAVLPAQTCKAMELWLERKTTPEIAVELGVSRSRVQCLVSEGTRKIHDKLARQEYRPAEAACTVFLLGPANYASLLAFQKTVDYLIRYKNVNLFCVSANYLSSPFRFVLEELMPRGQEVQAVYFDADLELVDPQDAVSTMPASSGEDVQKLVAQYLLSEAALAQIATPYCICNLALCQDEMVKAIQKAFLSEEERMSMFCDLGKKLPWG